MDSNIVRIANACLTTLTQRASTFEGNRALMTFQTWLRNLDGLESTDVERVYSLVSSTFFDSSRFPTGLWIGSVSQLRSAVEAAHPNLSFTVSDFGIAVAALKSDGKIMQIGAGSGRFLVTYDLTAYVDENEAARPEPVAEAELQEALESEQPQPQEPVLLIERLRLGQALPVANAHVDEMLNVQEEPTLEQQIDAQVDAQVAASNDTAENDTAENDDQEAPAVAEDDPNARHQELVRAAIDAARQGRHEDLENNLRAILRNRATHPELAQAGIALANMAMDAAGIDADGIPRDEAPQRERRVNDIEEPAPAVAEHVPEPVPVVEQAVEPMEQAVPVAVEVEAAPAVVQLPEGDINTLLVTLDQQMAAVNATATALRAALAGVLEENYILKLSTWQ